MSTNDAIRQAIDAFDLDEARRLLREALRDAPDAETYYLASLAAITPQQRTDFLRKSQALDPTNTEVITALQSAAALPAPLSAPPSAIPPHDPRPEVASIPDRSWPGVPGPPQTATPARATSLPRRCLSKRMLGGIGVITAILVITFVVLPQLSGPPEEERIVLDKFLKNNGADVYDIVFYGKGPTFDIIGRCVLIDPPIKGQNAFVLRSDSSTTPRTWMVYDPGGAAHQWRHVGCDKEQLAKALLNPAANWNEDPHALAVASALVNPTVMPTPTLATQQASLSSTCTSYGSPQESAKRDIDYYTQGDIVALEGTSDFLEVIISTSADATLQYKLVNYDGTQLQEGVDFIVARETDESHLDSVDYVFIDNRKKQLNLEFIAYSSVIPGGIGSFCLTEDQAFLIIFNKMSKYYDIYKPLYDWINTK